LKYCYCNQDFENTFKAEINDQNASPYYQLAFLLKMEKLRSEIEETIIVDVLTKENATYFYLESIKFNAERLQKACENLIVLHFAELSES